MGLYGKGFIGHRHVGATLSISFMHIDDLMFILGRLGVISNK